MFVTPEFLERETLPPVVIIGSGPAGMTLALTLAENRIASLILEAGDREFVDEIQDDYIGEVTGDPYYDLDAGRLRQFGGTSNHWAGRCRLMDASDFEPVPEFGIAGWPIAKSDLDPFIARADEILEIGETSDYPLADGLYEAGFVYSPPVKFSDKYEDVVATSSLVNVALRTAVTALHAEDGRVSRIDIVGADGQARSMAPQQVVLAGGGIENSRLLLWSNEVSGQRVVADPTPLGRFWMEHPHDNVGVAMLEEGLNRVPLWNGALAIGAEPELLRAHGALNTVVRLHPWVGGDLEEEIKHQICLLAPELLPVVNQVAGTRGTCGKSVRIATEQLPDFDNRVALSETLRDSFGAPKAHLYWRKTERDYRTVKVAFELVGTYLARSGLGMARASDHLIDMVNGPNDAITGGHHHMGGTRMSATSAEGVVDRDLRIHGMSNAYVAGSSVFVRGGHANPTLTIVQLSLRLGEHLARQVGG